LHKWKQKLGTNATSQKLISVFEHAGYKHYADNVRQMLVAEAISSDTADTTSTHSPKPIPEPKPEFPSIESISISSAATTTTTVVVGRENRQGIYMIVRYGWRPSFHVCAGSTPTCTKAPQTLPFIPENLGGRMLFV
jgi:hypothetical protein